MSGCFQITVQIGDDLELVGGGVALETGTSGEGLSPPLEKGDPQKYCYWKMKGA